MNPEPLKGKELHATIQDVKANWRNILYVEDVASAVEFYRKYMYEPDLFKKDFPEAYEVWNKQGEFWTLWLLDYSFADVVKK